MPFFLSHILLPFTKVKLWFTEDYVPLTVVVIVSVLFSFCGDIENPNSFRCVSPTFFLPAHGCQVTNATV